MCHTVYYDDMILIHKQIISWSAKENWHINCTVRELYGRDELGMIIASKRIRTARTHLAVSSITLLDAPAGGQERGIPNASQSPGSGDRDDASGRGTESKR